MKLEVGMYVRTKRKGIVKIDEIIDNGVITYEDDLGREWEEETGRKVIRYIGKDGWNSGLDEKEILKASYNIIDLIKSKDIILGRDGKLYQCWKIYKDYVFTYSKNKQGQTITLVDYQIDKVLTKEQFEQMAYKVGDK